MGLIPEATLGVTGALQQGYANAQADKYNAALATMNSVQAARNASMAAEAGSSQAGIQSMKARAEVGSIKTNQAAGNVDVNSGSAVDTRVSADELGKLDALQIRSNATKEAYGYQVQSTNFKNEASLDKFAASHELTAGWLNSASTLIGDTDNAVKEASGMFMGG